MAQVLATRMAFGQELLEIARRNQNFVVCNADTKTCGLEKFGKEFPEREFSFGIAEQNLVAGAAGLAACRNKVFLATFAVFASMRACEQVRTFVCYPKLNVTIIGTHAGLQVGGDGATHAAIEDIAIMRAIPGMVVLSPADDVEARAAVKAAYEHKGPVYIRFGRAAVPVIHEEENYSFEIGKAEVLRPGTDVAVAATGLMVAEALKAAETLAAEGINVRVINVCSIKPLDEETILAAARECGKIVTCEEHSIIGGLGEAVCSLVSEKHPVPVRRVGVNDEFGHSGPAAALLEEMGLCASHIAEVVRETVKG